MREKGESHKLPLLIHKLFPQAVKLAVVGMVFALGGIETVEYLAGQQLQEAFTHQQIGVRNRADQASQASSLGMEAPQSVFAVRDL